MELLATCPGIAEAPCFIGDDIWFTDLFSGIYRTSARGGTESLVENRRGVGGLVPHGGGGALASGRTIAHVAPTGHVTDLAFLPPNATGFNDLHTTPSGGLLASVLTHRPLAGDRPTPGYLAEVLQHATRELVVGPTWPNGVASSPDGERTYLADFATGDVLAIDPEGRVTSLARLDEGHADGLAVDDTGRVWVATGPGGTVVALAPDGRVDARHPVPAGFVASIAISTSGTAAIAVAGLPASGAGGLLLTDLGCRGIEIVPASSPGAGGGTDARELPRDGVAVERGGA
jgi:sugar lactone lactonase YvrE